MKILHVLIAPRAEGTPRLVLDWLGVPGNEQELLFLSEGGELIKNFQDTGVWQFYNKAFEPRVKTAWKIVRLVKTICRERKPDVVISWSLGLSHWVALGARSAGVHKNLAHAGNAAGETFMGRYVHTWISFTLGNLLGNKIIACSEYVKNSFTTIPLVSAKNIFAVYNCVQVRRFMSFNPGDAREIDFVMVATLEAHKDHITLLNAWKIYQGKNQDHRLFLAGDGLLRELLEKLSASLELKNVRFLGTVANIPELLQRSRTFVFSTTHQEGFGTVLIEAMAAGCKIIATDVPACREILENGTYGILVKEQDARALAESMEIESAKPMTPEQAAFQQRYAAQFTPEVMIRSYLAIASDNQNRSPR